MKPIIIPSIIAKNQKELNERIDKVGKYFKTLQIDVMDGKFVKSKSFSFDFKLPKEFKYEAHLMVNEPKRWIEKHGKKVDIIILHYKTIKDFEKIVKLIKSKKRKVGIAINPGIKAIEISYFDNVDLVLVMTVEPGRYGAKFLPETLGKIKTFRKLKPKIQIEVDGGINNKTIKLASKAGANRFVVGSYLQNSKNVRQAIAKLKNSL